MRVHDLESGQLMSRIYVKSRSNCLLFSHRSPIATTTRAGKKNKSLGDEREEDEESNVNSEDLGTDELWSDMETIVDEHPSLKKKSPAKNKNSKRLKDFSSESESDQDDEEEGVSDCDEEEEEEQEEEEEDDEEEEEEKSEFKKPK